MTTCPASDRRRPRSLAAFATRAAAWLVEPATAERGAPLAAAPALPSVAVVGLGPRCGTTTIARALAVDLAARDARGAAVVSGTGRAPQPALATPGARRLARVLGPAAGAIAVGRLCLVEEDYALLRALVSETRAPVVLDVGHGTPPEPAVALADRLVLVASPSVEPALAHVVARSLSPGGETAIVLNRPADAHAWAGTDALRVPESRLGARLAGGGRDAPGAFGAAVRELADRCERM